MTKQEWKNGLLASIIGGFATSIESGLTLVIVAPGTFNFGIDLWKTLGTVVFLGFLTGLRLGAGFLRQAPIPLEEEESKIPLENKPQ